MLSPKYAHPSPPLPTPTFPLPVWGISILQKEKTQMIIVGQKCQILAHMKVSKELRSAFPK